MYIHKIPILESLNNYPFDVNMTELLMTGHTGFMGAVLRGESLHVSRP